MMFTYSGADSDQLGHQHVELDINLILQQIRKMDRTAAGGYCTLSLLFIAELVNLGIFKVDPWV